ncbi:GntR family transcriptional regulator [Pseudomonas caspiana]
MRTPTKQSVLTTIVGDETPAAHMARAVIEETLRTAILDGRLPAGTPLRQQELATLFNVSRMPVREALRQLEAQSLVHVEIHKGAVVAPLIGEDAVEAYALRILHECEALRLSIPLLDDDDLAQARYYIEKMEVETDYTEIGRLNRQFHMCLYAKARNKRLMALVELGLSEEERFLRFNLSKMGLGKLAQDDHWELLRLAQSRNVEETANALIVHLNRGMQAVTRYLDSLAANTASTTNHKEPDNA